MKPLTILPKYFIREHVGPFLMAIFTINLVFILNILYRDLGKFLSKGVALPIIFEFLFLNLAWMIALSVPMAVLTATIMAFGRLSADNEINAVRASGISLYQLLPAILLTASLVAGALIWFNNHVLPDFNHQARLLTMDIARKKPMINLEAGVVYTDIPNYNILVQKVKDVDSVSYASRVVIDDQNEANTIKTIIADSAEIRFLQKTGLLHITLFSGESHEVNFHQPQEFKRLDFAKQVINIPMSEILLTRSQSEYRGDREKSAAALLESVSLNDQKIAERRQYINEKIRKQFGKYSAPQPPKTLLRNVITEHEQLARQTKADLDMINSYKKSNNIYLVEVHKKYSIPVACVVFILIGVPLGIRIHQRGWAIGAGLSIGFFLLYWAFLIGGESLADRQIISPFLAMWSPNIVIGGLGVMLILRAASDFSLKRWLSYIRLSSANKYRPE
jgi:lipopolysaccharide export system permease protein